MSDLRARECGFTSKSRLFCSGINEKSTYSIKFGSNKEIYWIQLQLFYTDTSDLKDVDYR